MKYHVHQCRPGDVDGGRASAGFSRPSCAILVPSYRRANDLRRCLCALSVQTTRPDQVIVVVRRDDAETRAALVAAGRHTEITAIVADQPGQVAALNVGLAAVTTDVTAITDDDAAPRPDWVARLLAHFGDPQVAGVGGRDVVIGATDGRHARVGVVGWYGRITGNHHRGIGPSRDVDVLKGANMAFRTEWAQRFGFDPRLRGVGAQRYNDLMLSLRIRRAGGRIIYDPEVVVDHYPAERPAGDSRTPDSLRAVTEEVHNETLALLEFLPPARRVVWFAWAVLCGTRRNPGFGMSLVQAGVRRSAGYDALMACNRGRAAGLNTWLRT